MDLAFKSEYGTITPTEPYTEWSDQAPVKVNKWLAKSNFRAEPMVFFDYGTAEFWLTTIGNQTASE